ncbi:MAG: adenylate/guanylate cyclase domain-containing protein [Alphaproteobacteria bacterium]|nr:adenylate/guanylate cyclase domain-containing protein [Alphaproteobacteria bacterium]MBO6864743.1 adenylate/guanylate cyclase domain-containing protein [Alphaproteobacteria bacterium]
MTVSIRFVMIVGFCGLLAVSVAAVIVTGVAGALGNTLTLMARDSAQMVEEARRDLETELAPIQNQSAYIADQFAQGRLRFDQPNRLTLALESSMAALPDLAGMLVMDTNAIGFRILGERRNGKLPAVTIGNFQSEPGLAQVIDLARYADKPVWRRPVWIPEIQQTVINLHTPLYRDGEYIGLLIQGKAVADLSSRLRDLEEDKGKIPFLLYGEGHVLAHPGLAELALDVTEEMPLPLVSSFQDAILAEFPNLQEVIFEKYAESENLRMGRTEFADRSYLFSYTEVTGIAADLPIVVGLYVDEARYQDFRDRLRSMILVGIGVLMISGILALLMAKATVRPILALSEASAQVASGNYDNLPVLPKSRMRELREASNAFEAMVHGLKERARILDLFGRVVPEKVAERMLSAPDELAPQTVEATVLFCDMANFTHMTEELGPAKVVAVLNAYFTDIVDVVHGHGGIVTQFQGDAILAVFNLPIADAAHAEKAVNAAREIQAHLAEREYEGRRLSCRIGIATGPLIAANVGAASRMNYTVHGDTVNLAARLEQLNKELGTTILIAGSTAARVRKGGLLSLGERAVRGRDHPIEVFAPLKDTVEAEA